jgi:hypothetical protein
MTSRQRTGVLLSDAAMYASESHRFLVACMLQLDAAEQSGDLAEPIAEMQTVAYLLAGLGDVSSDLQCLVDQYGIVAAVERTRGRFGQLPVAGIGVSAEKRRAP